MASQFWRPGVDRLGGEHADLVPNRFQHLSLQQQRQLLPIFKYKDNILYALEKYSTVIIVAETGSGKSTQIPLYLHEAGWTANNKKIACTQPRKVCVY